MRKATEHLNTRGQRKMSEWLQFCTEQGWQKSQMPKLADIWLEYHDESGELLPPSSPLGVVEHG